MIQRHGNQNRSEAKRSLEGGGVQKGGQNSNDDARRRAKVETLMMTMGAKVETLRRMTTGRRLRPSGDRPRG